MHTIHSVPMEVGVGGVPVRGSGSNKNEMGHKKHCDSRRLMSLASFLLLRCKLYVILACTTAALVAFYWERRISTMFWYLKFLKQLTRSPLFVNLYFNFCSVTNKPSVMQIITENWQPVKWQNKANPAKCQLSCNNWHYRITLQGELKTLFNIYK